MIIDEGESLQNEAKPSKANARVNITHKIPLVVHGLLFFTSCVIGYCFITWGKSARFCIKCIESAKQVRLASDAACMSWKAHLPQVT